MAKVKQLVEDLRPSQYKLYLSINEQSETFSGRVLINAEQLKAKDSIYLHADGLEIKSVEVRQKRNLLKNTYQLDEAHQYLVIESKELKTEPVEIEIKFNGKITESMVGLYPAKYKDGSQEKHIYATQLESHHAREVFPCIDEPSAKAVFELTLETQTDVEVLSNTPKQSQTKKDSRMITKFTPTPLMSTYLLAFVVGELKYLEASTKNDVVIRVWATPNHYQATEFALDVAVKSLELLEDFFGVAYPLDKCDLVAIPEFAAGAMENWGLITFREAVLLVDKHSKLAEKQRVTAVVAHELAHQWFGNLVTMKWWNDLWLNESFASFMEYYIPNKIFPNWELWLDFIAYDMITAQSLDRLQSSHPIEVEIEHPDQIRTVFDAISYEKGAIVIRMIEGFIGEQAFQAGLQAYMEKHAYKNTTTEDLWSALSSASGKDVASFAHTWTTQTGFPTLSVTKENKYYQLSQKRYLLHADKNDKQIWQIPISVSDKTTSMSEHKTKLEIDELTPLNKDHSGFFITNYSSQIFEDLMDRFEQHSHQEQIGLFNDIFQATKTGDADLSLALNCIPRMKDHQGSALWDVVLGKLGELRYSFVEGKPKLEKPFNDFINNLTSGQYQRLDWHSKDSDSIDDTLLRPAIIAQAVRAELPEAVEQANKLSKDLKQVEDLKPDVRSIVLRHLARTNPDSHKSLRKQYKSATSPSLINSLSIGLTSTEDADNISANIDMITKREVRLQDLLSWLAGLLQNQASRETAWTWIRQNWTYLKDRYGSDVMSQAYMPLILGRFLTTSTQLDEYRDFFERDKFEYMYNKVLQGEEILSWRVQWIANVENQFKEWLDRQS